MLSYIIENKYHHKFFEYMLYASYVLFVVAFSGVYSIDPSYMSLLNSIIKYYVCIFLLIRFNPYTEDDRHYSEERKFDRKIVFSAGIFLLLTTGITEYTSYILKTWGLPSQ